MYAEIVEKMTNMTRESRRQFHVKASPTMVFCIPHTIAMNYATIDTQFDDVTVEYHSDVWNHTTNACFV